MLLQMVKSTDKKDFKPVLFKRYTFNVLSEGQQQISPTDTVTVTLRDNWNTGQIK